MYMKKSMIFYTTSKMKKWSFPALFFLLLITLLIYSVYFLTVSPPSDNISRGFSAGSLKAEDIASNIANSSKMIKLSEQNLAVIFSDNGSLSFDIYDLMLERTKSFDTELQGIADFEVSGDEDMLDFLYIKDKVLYQASYDVKGESLLETQKLAENTEFVKRSEGYLLYNDEDELKLKTPDGDILTLMRGDIAQADLIIEQENIEIAAEVREEGNSRIDHIRLENERLTDLKTAARISTNTYTKVRNIMIFPAEDSSKILYSVRDNKSKQISYYIIENQTSENLAFLQQDSKPFLIPSASSRILFAKAVEKGNKDYFQIAQMEYINGEFINESILTKGRIFAGSPQSIELSGESYLKYEAVNAFSKDVFLASSKPEVIEKSRQLRNGELKTILTDSVSFAAFAYAFSLTYFGYIFIFAALIFFFSMFFFVGWTERNPHILILIISGAHLFAGLITFSTYLWNTENIMQLPAYLMNPVIPLALIVLSIAAGLWTVFRGYDANQLKHRLWEAYFQFFAVSAGLYMLIYFPFLAYNYL